MTDSDHRARVERAVRFIATSLHRPLSLKEVAAVAHLSEFHFHRIFSAVMGETVGRFITRHRLEVAALRLAYEPHRSITDVALASGYSSPSNFTKAFGAFFGCSPTQVRSPAPNLPPAIGKLTREYGKNFDPLELYALPPEPSESERTAHYAALAASVRFENCRGVDLACLSSQEGYEPNALAGVWAELIERARQLGITEQLDPYGITFDSPLLTAPELCRYHACLPCPGDRAVPAPLFRGRIPEGRYAVFSYEGTIAEVELMYRRIYSVWLPASGLGLDDFTAIHRYTGGWPNGDQIAFESWLKVRWRS
jgi:AraC family transcriptional regulator